MGKEGGREGGRRELNGRTETAAAMGHGGGGCPLRKGNCGNIGLDGRAVRVVPNIDVQFMYYTEAEKYFGIISFKCYALLPGATRMKEYSATPQ